MEGREKSSCFIELGVELFLCFTNFIGSEISTPDTLKLLQHSGGIDWQRTAVVFKEKRVLSEKFTGVITPHVPAHPVSSEGNLILNFEF